MTRRTADQAILDRPTGDRHPEDFCITPARGVQELLRRETFSGTVWDPACGDGSICRALEAGGYASLGSDLIDRGHGYKMDFFDHTRLPSSVEAIVTNPPYMKMMPEEFLHHSLRIGAPKVALLLRILWLSGARRGRTVFGGATPLKAVYPFSYRLGVTRDGYPARSDGKGGMIDFAWFIWERGHIGDPIIRWIT
jgi:hypothetical protein